MSLQQHIKERILVLDGSMGVMLQREQLSESQVRGERFKSHPVDLNGNNDILVLTNPDIVANVHRRYLEAGADIIETNTFNSQRVSQREYQTEHLVRELNLAAAGLARKEADRMTALNPSRPRFVAGSVGPMPVSLTLPSDVSDPAFRSHSFSELKDAFEEQIDALIDGGVDLILIETVFDLLNAKAAVSAYLDVTERKAVDVPVIISATVGKSGRLLSGHTLEAFVAALSYAKPLAFGLNCSSGPDEMLGHARLLSEISPFPVVIYPNAGLPDSMGLYDVTPERFCSVMERMMDENIINVCGGCCGTTPEHISMLSDLISGKSPRICSNESPAFLAGLDSFRNDGRFINVGERCNVAGSRKFLRLIKEGKRNEALEIARRQVADGAMILDINMDDGLLYSSDEMNAFLRYLSSDPVTASVPWMIDSSDFDLIMSALENTPGKPVVNSISLKVGEDEFLRRARCIRKMGAAVVVMAFDEAGQATTFVRKCEICSRAYTLLVEKAGFEPSDIIFDPNILTIATGISEHDTYARDYIKAIDWIYNNLPGAKTSGGLSNLSFAFRGNDYLRRAMHSVFLHHAVRAGLSMAIMNPAENVVYGDIPTELRDALEDAVLCRKENPGSGLLDIAGKYSGVKEAAQISETDKMMETDPNVRIRESVKHGDERNLEDDIRASLEKISATDIVDGPLMEAMEDVGRMFESGEMFLPQVVKSAHTMHRAVEILTPYLSSSQTNGTSKGLWLVATVRGDVHDIGKNIASVVLRCNNYDVVDLGVQVEPDEIVRKVRELKPDIIGLSGLISPSLAEMKRVAIELKDAGINTPLIVGGAATSDEYSALEISPAYDGIVVRVSDAARNPIISAEILSSPADLKSRLDAYYGKIREKLSEKSENNTVEKVPIPEINPTIAPVPNIKEKIVLDSISLQEILPFINYTYLCNCWKVRSGTPEADSLIADARSLVEELISSGVTMKGMVRMFDAYSSDDKIVVTKDDEIVTEISALRKKRASGSISLSDFIGKKGRNDHIGVFAVTIGEDLRKVIADAKSSGNEYRYLLIQSVADRLAEATSEWLHYTTRKEYWGYHKSPESAENIRCGKYPGIRPAIGYPSLPDQREMHKLDKLLNLKEIGIDVTVNGALSPSSSVAGIYIASPESIYF